MSESYADRWRSEERELADRGVELVACGEWVLPGDAAPCLSFDRAARPRPIWEVFGIPTQWSAEERERLAPYRMIGSDGAGNPICVEAGSGAVWLLDHEDRFRTRQFVNSGVGQLAECLLAYFGERDPERFRAAVMTIDPPALAERAFWWHEAAGLGAFP
jgi:hypothetical protein